MLHLVVYVPISLGEGCVSGLALNQMCVCVCEVIDRFGFEVIDFCVFVCEIIVFSQLFQGF